MRYGQNSYDNPAMPRVGTLMTLTLIAAAMGGTLRVHEPDNYPHRTPEPAEKIPGYAARMRQIEAEERRERKAAKRAENLRKTMAGKAACRAS